MAHAGVDPDPVAQFGKALKAIEQMRKINEYNKDPPLENMHKHSERYLWCEFSKDFLQFYQTSPSKQEAVSRSFHSNARHLFFFMSQAACKLDSAVFLNARD